MGLGQDLKTLYYLTAAPRRGNTPAERLENFYRGQASAYDGFREKLLQGRRELVDAIPFETLEGGVWVDFGGGTGSNVELAGNNLARLKSVYIVDLCPSLLEVARRRMEKQGWENVRAVEADAGVFTPEEAQVDLVTFSYSLTMMPDWLAVLEHALSLLRPGGTIAVVDFYVSRKHEAEGHAQHGWWTRTFWTTWFAFDDVFLSAEPLAYLRRKLEASEVKESRATVPYLPFGRVPYYRFLGRKRV